MSEQCTIPRRGRGGRPSKGPRFQLTVRCPEALAEVIEEGRAAAGMATNDYVVELLRLATEAGLTPVAEAGQERLPLSA